MESQVTSLGKRKKTRRVFRLDTRKNGKTRIANGVS